MSVKVQIDAVTKRIQKLFDQAKSKNVIEPVANEAIKIIVRRTRLGYGVKKAFGERERLKKLSPKYIVQRSRSRRLSSTTSARKSNLTFTGQMLESVQVIKSQDGKIVIGPRGYRSDGKQNQKIAQYQVDQGRTFMNISRLEFQQILRFYRLRFTDLRKKLGLIQR